MALDSRGPLSWLMGMLSVAYIMLLPAYLSDLRFTTSLYFRKSIETGNRRSCASAAAH